MDCFVTGKWEAAEDAEALLKEDGKNRFTSFLLKSLSAMSFIFKG